jgi:hypothetical protein
MHTTPMMLVTIVAEPVLEPRLLGEFAGLGARGWTVTDARGAGSRHMRATDPPGANVRIETVVSAAVADAILTHLAAHYFPRYAVIAWATAVAVVRGDKYA